MDASFVPDVLRIAEGTVIQGREEARLSAPLAALVGFDAASRILARFGALALRSHVPARDLADAGGVPLSLAERVVAAREIATAIHARRTIRIAGVDDVVAHLPLGFELLEIEVLLALALDARGGVKATVVLSRGGIASATVGPRDVFVPLVRLAATAVVLAHNHPSGSPDPSPADVVLTNRLAAFGRALGIAVLDHVVVATEGVTSFAEAGLMPTADELDAAFLDPNPAEEA